MTYKDCDLILSVKAASDHEKWLKTRDLGIGGSDAAVVNVNQKVSHLLTNF